jgi:hypothetical protein
VYSVGLPFLILNKILECFVLASFLFWLTINSKASKLENNRLISAVLQPKFKIIFLSLGIFLLLL